MIKKIINIKDQLQENQQENKKIEQVKLLHKIIIEVFQICIKKEYL